MNNKMLKILFLCTGNSCRSQMAEGMAKKYKAESVQAYSAGVEPKGIDKRAVTVMNEIDIDISSYRSKNVSELMNIDFDYVITLCGHARETCPIFPGKARITHAAFEDPPELAENARDEEEALYHYRKVRDQIKEFIETIPDSLA